MRASLTCPHSARLLLRRPPAQLSILARRNGRVSKLSGRIDSSSVPASKRNTRGRTSSRDHEHNTADPQPRPRPTLLHNMAPDRNRNWVRNNLGKRCNSLRSPLPRTGPKAKEPTESIASIWFLFHLQLVDQQCSSSYNTIRFRRSFTRVHLTTEIVETISRSSCLPKGCGASFLVAENLHNALIEHRVSHLHEPCDVRANYKIARMPILLGGFPGVLVDREHDMTQTGIHFFAWPW